MNKIKVLLLLIAILASGCRRKCDIFLDDRGMTPSLVESAENCCVNSLCDLLERSLQKDETAIIELIELKIFSAPSYDHGVLVVELIRELGEDFFVSIIKDYSFEQKQHLIRLINVGLEFDGKSEFHKGLPRVAFPRLDSALHVGIDYVY